MVCSDVSLERIFEHYDDITRDNGIKLLLRCKMLYEARVDVKNILLSIIKKEMLFTELEHITAEAMQLGTMELGKQRKVFLGLKLARRLNSQIS